MKLFNSAMIRVPQFPHNARLEDVWSELLESIAYASPDFYKLVAHLQPIELKLQEPKIKNTIFKYFNRAKYRCTPLGTFSSFGIVGVDSSKPSAIQIKNIRTFHSFADWKKIQQFEYEFADVLERNYKLFSNSTYYVVGNSIRFVRRKENVETFELAEVELRDDVIDVLNFLNHPSPISHVLKALHLKYSKDHLLNLIESMILTNLLLTEADPNTVGTDYFFRINKEKYKAQNPYIISELNYREQNLSPKHFKNLSALVDLLTEILPTETNSTHISDFVSKYTKRFDRKNMPIMEALDPQIGVGYGDLHTGEKKDSLMNLLLNKTYKDKKEEEGTILNQFIKSKITFKAGDVIDLSKLEIRENRREVANKLPNTFSVIGSLIDDNFHLERIGGHSANQLAGRFTICGTNALHFAKDIANLETEANPDVIFFDIVYHAELAVDNINRRTLLYAQELNLISYPSVAKPITLNDLYISISGNAIVLRSKLLGKRVIPRMASAYNYRRSQLPVFRFLYDLSFHNLWPELSFDLTRILPDIRFYPKVIFRDIVISLPKMIIYSKELKRIPEEGKVNYITDLMHQYGIGTLVKMVNGEEHMVYDLTQPGEMRLFLLEIATREQTTIEEMVLPNNTLVTDEQDRPYINQLIIPMYHKEQIYGESAAIIQDTTTKDRDFLPLMEWAYYDIFLHPMAANEILLNPIQKVLKQHEQTIEKWFFIRYNEGGEHIRLRIKSDQQTLIQITMQLSHSLRPNYNAGRISNFNISTYQRELERYDVVGMANVERHFFLGSQLVIRMLQDNNSDTTK
ncbi:MAG TPA: hypothetical protein DCO90_10475, partial [Sphingobacterium sp.]|nr:hypothetical protein [Sphingobacterium sp.]